MAQADLSTQNLENRLSIEDTEKIIRQIFEFDLDYSKWVKENANSDRIKLVTLEELY